VETSGARVFASPYQWNLYGAGGRSTLGGDFGKVWQDSRGNALVLARIHIRASWLDRTSEVTDFTDLREDFSIELSQVPVLRQRVVEFVDELRGWLDTRREIHKSFCPSATDQKVSFHIGPQHPHNKLQGPEFWVQYSGIGFESGKWSFVIDESCIRIFVDELAAAVRAFDAE